jgi:cytochrome o ubiquinol oxidase subunit 2
VVALQWKWLFIYPGQNIATVNFVQFPENTPVNFIITADAPMNSFWIPQLGGQIYAMPGMSTQLHLMANGAGSYRGVSANLSGQGFADMKFIAKSSSSADFKRWVHSVSYSHNALSLAGYDKLALPSQNNLPAAYSSKPTGLYDTIITKYMITNTSSATIQGSPHG